MPPLRRPADDRAGTLCYIGIGSNLGDRRGYIDRAIDALRKRADTRVGRISSIYETAPVGGVAQGPYLNGVFELSTSLDPRALLAVLQGIERSLGRVRAGRNAPRTIDLDILYYGDRRIDETDLTVPHPRLFEREFVLRGLRELGRA